MQIQTSNTLHNAIMEAGGKDRPPMLAPGNYVYWKSRIKRYINTKPNHELIHYCLKNPPYKLTWADKEVPISKGSHVTRNETYKETYKNVLQDIRDQLNVEAEAVQIILTGIDDDIYSTVDACLNACEMWKAIERLKQGESINVQYLKTNLYWEFRKFTSQDSESLESYYSRFYKMMNELIRNQCDSQELKTVSYHKLYDILKQHQNEVNEIRAERIARGAVGSTVVQKSGFQCYNCKEFGHVGRECQKPKRVKDAAYHREKMLLFKHEDAGIQLNAEQADWRDDTDDELDDQELKAHYIPFDYDKLNNLYDLFVPQREKSSEQIYFSERSRLSHTPVNNGNSKESFNKQKSLFEKRMDESILWDQKCKSSIELFKIKSSVGTIFDGVEHYKETIAKRTYFGHIDPFIKNTIDANFSHEIRRINAGLEQFYVCLNEEMVADLRYFNSLELEVDSLRSQLETQKTQFLNEIDRLSKEYYYADHINAIFGVYTELDEVTNLQCDYLELLEKCECLEKELSKSKMMSKSFESVQKHAINLELELQQCKEKMKNDKSFKVNQSKEFYKEREQYFEIQDLKVQLQDKGIVIRVIPTTSVSRPQLKSNLIKDRVMLNNSQGKKQEVEDQRRNVKLSKNKTSVTACNDSLNAKTLNVNFVCATCGKCVLNENHDMCVLKSRNGVNSRTKMPVVVPVSTREPKRTIKQSVAKPIRKTVALESNQKPRNITKKLYECISKARSWWYPKFTLSGYKWKPKTGKENVTLNHMTGNLKLLINFVKKFLGTVKFRNDQIEPILGWRSGSRSCQDKTGLLC
nr:hypothetical protein [Tanacetum cinerariifolium]